MDYAPRVISALKNTFSYISTDFTEKFCQLLTDTGSVIAGGFVLGAVNGNLDKDSDIDIYAPNKTFKPVLKFLQEHCAYEMDVQFCSAYDKSFFKKNGIMARFCFLLNDEHDRSIDLLILNEQRAVKNVVSNFDLTFCEIWFDGSKVEATDIEGVLNKKGILRDEYVHALLVEHNHFTAGRMKKYSRRGYTITIEPGSVMEYNVMENGFSPSYFVASHFLRNLHDRFPDVFQNHPDLITLDFDVIFNYMEKLGKIHGIKDFDLLTARYFLTHILKRCNADRSNCQVEHLIDDLLSKLPRDERDVMCSMYRHTMEDIRKRANNANISDFLRYHGVRPNGEKCTIEQLNKVFAPEQEEFESIANYKLI